MAPILLYLGTLCIVYTLILLVETVVLQLMRWGAFRQSVIAALAMNLASILIGIILLALVPQFGFYSLLIALILSTLVEGAVLTQLKRDALGYNFLVALAANLASYLILLLPAFYYSTVESAKFTG
jgi:ABC-type microcin C transport system permease subunit YejE